MRSKFNKAASVFQALLPPLYSEAGIEPVSEPAGGRSGHVALPKPPGHVRRRYYRGGPPRLCNSLGAVSQLAAMIGNRCAMASIST
jgi:hypothetical protein